MKSKNHIIIKFLDTNLSSSLWHETTNARAYCIDFDVKINFCHFWIIYLFIYRLFEENADLLTLFDRFQELKTKEQQVTSEELAEHATKVMESLDEGIRGLDDLDTFMDFIHQVGATHKKIPGFKPEYFWVSKVYTFINFHHLVTYIMYNFEGHLMWIEIKIALLYECRNV